MNSKTLYKLILLSLTICITKLWGQSHIIYYQMDYKRDSLSKEYIKKDMILEINSKKSKFYSYKQYRADSILFTNKNSGPGLKKLYDYEFTVTKDLTKPEVSRYVILLKDLYEIPLNQSLKWNITKETKKIDEYNCQKALLSYKGRNWEAWFSSDIPINDGPYIFNGLPGLILEIKDKKDNYIFTLKKIEKKEVSIENLSYFNLNPLKISEDQLKKVLLNYYNDPYKEIKSGQLKAKWKDENGKEIVPDFKELTKSEQNIIRKNNNPIELSEAISYPSN